MDEITLGEVNRNVEKLDKKIDNLTDSLSKAVTDSEMRESIAAARDISQRQIDTLRADIRALEDWQVWAQRVVLGAIILAILGVVISNSLP